MTFGSLFAGIGGFDLGFEKAGMNCAWQVEQNKQCLRLLRRRWPSVWRWPDVKSFLAIASSQPQFKVDLLCGGDPCPKHGNARRGQRSAHPDLSGYFLALAGRLRPRWLVRENVPSKSVSHFTTALEALGYGTVVVRFNAADFTCQNRIRDFVVANRNGNQWKLRGLFPSAENDSRVVQSRIKMGSVYPTLTCNRTRHNTDDTYVFHTSAKGTSAGLRILHSSERARLAGFPEDWADGFSETAQARMYGNSVCPPVVETIGTAIMRFEKTHGSQSHNSAGH